MALLKKLKDSTSGNQFILNRFYPYLGILILSYFVADLVILNVRPKLLPTAPLPQKTPEAIPFEEKDRGSYGPIANRNIFASNGVVPPAIRPKEEDPSLKKEQPARPTQLPLNLIGTLVHSNPEKSLASIELKNKNQILAFKVGQDIENAATIEFIDRQVVFMRSRDGQLEYLEMKSANKLSFDQAPKPAAEKKKDVQQVGSNVFSIKRSDLNKYTADLSAVLMQARAVPARREGTGETYGWKLQDIQPDSIFTQLGLLPNDTITGVNGNNVTNVQQAMEMYQTLKSSNRIVIQRERNGVVEEVTYNVTE
ncbi:MAG: type II secretion system protein GspC [Pseudobdellovibrionaceae bacterium]